MRRGPALTLGAATAAYAVIAVTYALTVPVGSSADEVSHLNYATVIADHAALPGATMAERQQPPLYYLLSAGLLRAGAGPVALRLLSVAVGLVTIACVVLTVRALVPSRPWLAAGAGAALALLPGFQFVSASITDDSVAAAAGALLLLVTTLVALAPGPSRHLLWFSGVSIGIALLSKETDLPLAIVLLAVLGWRWRAGLRIADVLHLAVPAVLVAGWWYARNLLTFHRPLPPLTPIGVPPNTLRTAGELRTFLTQSLRGLFSPERYQGSPVDLPATGRLLLDALAAAALALAVVGGLLAARRWRAWDAARRTAVASYAAAALLAFLFSLGNAVVIVFQPQGRYLLVAATGPLLALTWAIARLGLTRVRSAALAIAYAAAALTLSIIGLTTAMSGRA